MARIVRGVLEVRSIMAALCVAVMVLGVFELDRTRVEVLPEFNPPYVEVQTEALGLSAFEVEQLITVPLEADLLNGVAFVEEIRSQSIANLSSIVMTFEPGTDILDARQLVQERLTQAAGLPNVSRAPAMVQPLSSESRIMMIGLTSDSLSLVDLGVLARWTIRPKLMGVDGVANVAVWGHRERQLQVLTDLDKLAAKRVTLQDVVNTAGNALWVTPLTFLEASTPGVGGFIDGPTQRIGIRHVPAISNPEDLARVVIDGRSDLVIGDVATVIEDHQPLIGEAIVDGEPGLYLVVEKFPWSSTRETTEAVETALTDLGPGLENVDVDADLFRPADYIDRSVDHVQRGVLIALVLVALLLLTLLGRWLIGLATLVVAVVLVTATGLVYRYGELTVDSMVLLGLAIGAVIIVDDSIRNVREMSSRRSQPTGLVDAASSNTGPLAFVAIILVVALLPSWWMEGSAGEFVPVIATGLGIALIVGFVGSVTIAPSVVSLIPGRGDGEPGAALDRGALERWYEPVLGTVRRAPRTVALLGLALLVVGGALIPALYREFVPTFRQTDLLVSFETAPGVSLPEGRRITSKAADELAALPGVERAGVQLGRAILSDEISGVDRSVIWLSIDPSADYDDTLRSIREIVDGYPGVGRPDISSYTNDRVGTTLQEPDDDLIVRVYGEDRNVLIDLAQDLTTTVASLDGVENARALLPVTEPTIEIEVDLDKAREVQIKPGDARRAAATVFAGIEVGALFEEQKVFEVVVWSSPDHRLSVDRVEQLLIDTPEGRPVPLDTIADVRVVPNDRVIERDAVSRYIDVVADVPDRDVGAVEDEITALIEEQGLPFEFHVSIIANKADSAANARGVIAVSVTVAVVIFLLLQAALSSWRLAGIVMLASVAALAGGIVAMVIADRTYSIGSMAGLVAVAGLTLRAAIDLARRYESLQLDGREPGPDLVAEGARLQFRPTLITLVAIGLATLPLIVFGEIAGLEVLRPFAITVLGGIVTSAIISVAVLPAAYQWLARPALPAEDLLRGGAT